MSKNPKQHEMTVSEAGHMGGEAMARTHGHEFFEEIGKKGGDATKQKYGPDFYKTIGEKGGEATAKTHDHAFYAEIGHKGGAKTRELIEKGARMSSSSSSSASTTVTRYAPSKSPADVTPGSPDTGPTPDEEEHKGLVERLKEFVGLD